MALLADLRTIYHLVLSKSRGKTYAERLESFYRYQAKDYDGFRKRLLQGRTQMLSRLHMPEGGIWIDMGGGTGFNVEAIERNRLDGISKVYIVDLCPSLLRIAQDRIARNAWQNVEAIEVDATSFVPPEGTADLITFSYSLTMIPNWFVAIEHASKLLKPSGQIGIVDFYVARKFPDKGQTTHSWITRTFWPMWFAVDNVFLSGDHLPYLHYRFQPQYLQECRARVPFMPCVRVPYYIFIGTPKNENL